MSWNNGLNKAKFNQEQKEQKKKYQQFGMSDEQIQVMQQLDLEIFNSNRRYAEHTQPIISDETFESETKNPLLKVFSESFSTEQALTFDYFSNWIDEIDNQILVEAIKTLSEEDKEILRLLAVYGYSHKEIGEQLHTSRQCITSKIRRIRKALLLSFNSNGGDK